MRSAVPGNDTGMKCDAGPRDALHERHRCAVVDVAFVIDALFENGEYAGRRIEPRLTTGNSLRCDFTGTIENTHALLADRYQQQKRAWGGARLGGGPQDNVACCRGAGVEHKNRKKGKA